ncbi:MAG: hypothetical protein M5R40_12745 [Anaerolineae bacterium]|nr:hypothetical protein [Anaerolineae bacterium]
MGLTPPELFLDDKYPHQLQRRAAPAHGAGARRLGAAQAHRGRRAGLDGRRVAAPLAAGPDGAPEPGNGHRFHLHHARPGDGALLRAEGAYRGDVPRPGGRDRRAGRRDSAARATPTCKRCSLPCPSPTPT